VSLLALDLFERAAESTSIDEFSTTVEGADEIYVKKLALNDWQWTEDKDKHQHGPYIPHEDRESDFFPKLAPKKRKVGKPIFEAFFDVHWPEIGQTWQARLVHYTSKGQETHLTNVPRGPFTGISPASYLVIAKRATPKAGEHGYQAIIVDSAGDECTSMIDLFEIQSDFRSMRFSPRKAVQTYQERVLQFIEEALGAFKAGRISAFSKPYAAIPKTKELAILAQKEYMKRHPDVSDFNPFSLSNPGDVALEISRDIEYELFREYQLRHRSLELVKVILGTDPKSATVETALRTIIREFPRIDKILLSAAQQRKSRAGYSFEHHIEKMLIDGEIPHEVQVVIESKKRPDFVLPTFALYSDTTRPREHALVLSAKTTLRERWTQVMGEIKNCALYLATVDENIAANAIEDMDNNGITLVVPESLKKSDATAYKKQTNVIGFREFFVDEIKNRRGQFWASLGIRPHAA
jgi:hypothetical protein